MSEESGDTKHEAESLPSLQSLNLKNDDDLSENIKKEDGIHKIDIFLKPTANAPIMKKQKWSVDSSKPISWIAWFVSKYIKLEPHEKLFLYVNQAFAPAPDQILRNLYNCYNTEGKLVLHYCKSQAWG